MPDILVKKNCISDSNANNSCFSAPVRERQGNKIMIMKLKCQQKI